MGLAVACGLLTGAVPSWAAPGGGAAAIPTTCVVSVLGFPDATGTGKVVLTPSGRQNVNCQAQLPDGATPPAKTVRFAVGPCTVVITPAGGVNAHCVP